MTNNYTKKSNHPKIFIKVLKKKVPKKITSSKNKINYDAQALKKQKKKKEKKKEETMLMLKKKK